MDRIEDARAKTADDMALDAQTALLPYALAVFGLGLGLFAWASAYAANSLGMAASLVIFAINLAVFYVLNGVMAREPLATRLRRRLHVLGGLLWAAAIGQVCLFASHAGPAREVLLLLAAGAAGACFVFASPLLLTLLTVAPIAAAAPLIGLYLSPETRHTADAVAGALALGMILALVVNRILRRQFDLMVAHERLTAERAASMTAVDRLAKSKSDLLATLSHQIRNGLTGVVHVLARAAETGGRAAPSREQLAAALGAARDLVSTLDATLDSEMAEAGRLAIRNQPFDAAMMASDLVHLMRNQAVARGLELSLHIDPALEGQAQGAAVADSARARQVLSALLQNAIRYTVRGRVELRVTRAGERLRFEVADTGPGLSADELDRAFAPFTRIERTCAGEPGAGLGLSLARRIAELMAGEIGADSALGAGSCFWLDLPFDPTAAATRSKGEAPPVAALRSGPLKIMVADEDRLSAAMLRATLENLGHQVVQAHSLNRVGDLLKACEVDLLLLGGETAAQTAASLADRQSIIGLIEHPEEGKAFLSAGCRSVMRKPAGAQAVARAIATAMSEAAVA